MSTSAPTIACVGNAVVDAIVGPGHERPVGREHDQGTNPAAYTQSLSERFDAVATWVPGGSAANTAAELARIGADATYVGRVRDDALGRSFVAGLREVGAGTLLRPAPDGAPTSRIYVFVDERGERSFEPALGASEGLCADDVLALRGRALSAVHVEAYLLYGGVTSGAFEAALSLCEVTGALSSVTLGTPSCAKRFRDTIMSFARAGAIELLIGNEEEFVALTGASEADLVQAMRGIDATCVMTRGKDGSLAISNGTVTECPAHPVERVIDTTGAGDAFAAGFLSVHAHDGTLMDALRKASACGAEAVGRVGARAVRG